MFALYVLLLLSALHPPAPPWLRVLNKAFERASLKSPVGHQLGKLFLKLGIKCAY